MIKKGLLNMTEHEKSLEIINELNLSLVDVGENYEKLDQHKKK